MFPETSIACYKKQTIHKYSSVSSIAQQSIDTVGSPQPQSREEEEEERKRGKEGKEGKRE